jgi:hypothetical protein
MLVPTTWLSRDYAHPVQYLLARWFDIRYVVEDADAAWFSDALVRTTLVVATRVERRDSAFAPQKDSGHLHLKLGRELADERSVVGAAYRTEDDPDLAFAHDAEAWHAARSVPSRSWVDGHWVPAAQVVSALKHATEREEWLSSVETHPADAPDGRARPGVPPPLAAAVGALPDDASVTLDELGWRVGQGLRTGANQLFYGEAIDANEDVETIAVAPALGGGTVDVPLDALRPVLRRQSDLPQGFAIVADELQGRVLVLDSYALPEDRDGAVSTYRATPAALAEHIRRAAATNVGSDDEPKFIPALSAVATNVRLADPGRPQVVPRFWYQLPPFTSRHRASLALARVNHTHPKTYLNTGRDSIIDANFSTLWPTDDARIDDYALLALMNSSWVAAALETSCTVLGGGALKVEAAHLRLLPLPNVRPAAWKKLSALGRRLAATKLDDQSRVLAELDELLMEEWLGPEQAHKALAAVKKLAAERLAGRSR